MRSRPLIIIALLICFHAQLWGRQRRFMSRADSILTVRLERLTARIDTNYIQIPDQIWTFRSLGNIGISSIDATGRASDSLDYHTELNTDPRGTLTLTANYRGFTVGFALNPAKLSGRNKDMEMYILAYGNRFGAEFLIQSASTYSGKTRLTARPSGQVSMMDIGKGITEQRGILANLYYAFNYKRFSYPAAFTQSYLQVRPAGSLIINASFQHNIIERKNAFSGDERFMQQISTNLLGIGAGYAYHFVPNRHWLIHISCQPSLVIFSRNGIRFPDSQEQRLKFYFPEAIILGQFAAIYSWDKFFAGMNTSYHYSNIGRTDDAYINLQTTRVRLLFGVRI
ncbi:MAG: DUF4421 family protein [Paludibacteraceae bacterium]|nr:DUF4421 family protein [Paludibacteraceae bacterium]